MVSEKLTIQARAIAGEAARKHGITPVGMTQSARIALQRGEIMAEALRGVMDILGSAESNASGNPEWDYVGPRVTAARAALAQWENSHA